MGNQSAERKIERNIGQYYGKNISNMREISER